VVTKVLSGVLPVTQPDFLALMHDIDYLKYSGDESLVAKVADMKAILSSDYSLEGLLMKAGLLARTAFGLSSFHVGSQPIKLKKTVSTLLKQHIRDFEFDNYNSAAIRFGLEKEFSTWLSEVV